MAVQDRLFTAKDLADMPDDGKIYELHNGVLVEVAGSKYRQTRSAAWIIYLLTAHIVQNKLGGSVSGADGTFELNRYNTRIPDVAYVREEQKEAGFHRGAPDLGRHGPHPGGAAQAAGRAENLGSQGRSG